MTDASGERWVIIAALVVLGIYAYRRLTEATATGGITVKGVLGLTNPLPISSFITAWGFVFFILSLMASASPALGGTFALLIMTTDFLTNAPALFAKGSSLNGPSAEQTAAASEVGKVPGFTDTASGPAVFVPPPGIKAVP